MKITLLISILFLNTIQIFAQTKINRSGSLEEQRPKEIPMRLFELSRYLEDQMYFNDTYNESFIVEPNPYIDYIIENPDSEDTLKELIRNCRTFRITCISEDSSSTNNISSFCIRVISFKNVNEAEYYRKIFIQNLKTNSTQQVNHIFFQTDEHIYEIMSKKELNRDFKKYLLNIIKAESINPRKKIKLKIIKSNNYSC